MILHFDSARKYICSGVITIGLKLISTFIIVLILNNTKSHC